MSLKDYSFVGGDNQAKLSLLKKSSLFVTAAASALMVASSAYAQDPGVESVTVSSSRIVNSGMQAPTPTTVMAADFIQQQNKDNIFTAVTQLPSLMGSTGVQSNVNATSGGTNGLASFNVFGLGTVRTLTLLDGQRFVPGNVAGINDINQFPQMLIQRVDVVTGGASASWGSDAIAGVVNVITDKTYIGFKTNVSTGISNYRDNATLTIGAAAGTSFAGGRGHFTVSVDYSHSDGVEGNWKRLSCCGGASLTDSQGNGRSWYVAPSILAYNSPGVTPAGQPQFYLRDNGTSNQFGRTGMINSGPLQGIGFNPDGTTYRRDFGVGPNGLPGVPAKNGSAGSAGTVTNCPGTLCIGGDNSAQTGSGGTMSSPITRGNFYARLSYDIAPKWNIYTTVSMGETQSSTNPNSNQWRSGLPGLAGAATQTTAAALTSTIYSTSPFNAGQMLVAPGIQCGNAAGGANAYLPASINQACIDNNITSFGFGSLFYGLGPQKVHSLRNSKRFAFGLDGSFELMGTEWNAVAYAQHGKNNTRINVNGIANLPNLYHGVDTIKDSQGVVVCRNTVARTLGCIAVNPFTDEFTQAQKNWVYGGKVNGPGPLQISKQHQNNAEFVISGSPIKNWAGDVSIAVGAGWREDGYTVRGDAAGNGLKLGPKGAPGTPCNNPVQNCANGTNWYAGSFHNANGYFSVREAFTEIEVPLLDSSQFGNVDLSLAGRHADYSTSGSANTWKVGMTWDTPIDGVRFRAMQSRDFRAPNLSELYAAPTTANSSNSDPWRGGTIQVIGGALGNPNLKAEKSLNTQLGVVFTPSWLPGFSTSIDYYRIGVGAQISAVDRQTSVNNCYAGLTQYCSAIIVAGGLSPAVSTNWVQVNQQAFNTASTTTDGFNVEATYQFSLADAAYVSLPGDFTFRNLVTYVTKFVNTPGIAGTFPLNTAGAAAGAGGFGIGFGNVPHAKGFFTQQYEEDNWEIHVSENWVSKGKFNNNWVQCVPGSCPVSTLKNATTDRNNYPAIVYFNVGGSVKLDDHWTVYTQIDNVLNEDPVITGHTTAFNAANNGTNPTLYDTVGRMFHVGVRINN